MRRIAAFLRDARDGDDVVQTHDHVGDDDDPHGVPERRCVPVRLLRVCGGFQCLLLRAHELPRDPQQQDAGEQLEDRNPRQPCDQKDEQDAQAHRAARAEDLPPETLLRRQRAGRERDDECIVAGEDEVREDDLSELREGFRGGEIHAWKLGATKGGPDSDLDLNPAKPGDPEED